MMAITATRRAYQRHSVDDLRARERRKYDRAYFAQHYWREDLAGLVGNRGLSYDDPTHQRRFAFLYKALIQEHSVARLLDVGCGPGFLVEAALANGIDAFGLDVSDAAFALFNDRTQGKWCDRFELTAMDRIPFKDSEFDLCLCLDVLEHVIVFDIFNSVKELCRVASDTIVCSINLDNPYKFHPTVLSRDSWIAVFEAAGTVFYDLERTRSIAEAIRREYPEYDVFVFRRV